jgi:hypothetical protein
VELEAAHAVPLHEPSRVVGRCAARRIDGAERDEHGEWMDGVVRMSTVLLEQG